MNILEHNAGGATIHLDQRELLMVMALVEEGRDSFGCNGLSGRALDQLFCTANLLVEEARREELKKNLSAYKIGSVAPPEHELAPGRDASNG